MWPSEKNAIKILKRNGFKNIKKILFNTKIKKPRPDLIAIYNGKRCLIEVKSFNPDYNRIQQVAQRPS